MNITDGGVWMRWQWWVALVARGAFALLRWALAAWWLAGKALTMSHQWFAQNVYNARLYPIVYALRAWGEGRP